MHQLWRKRKICSVFLPSLFFFKIFCNGTRLYNEVPLRNNNYYQSIKKFFDIYTKRTVVLLRGWFFFFFQSLETLKISEDSNCSNFIYIFFCVKPQCEWLRYVVQTKKSPVQRFQRRRFSEIYFMGNAAGNISFWFFYPLSSTNSISSNLQEVKNYIDFF